MRIITALIVLAILPSLAYSSGLQCFYKQVAEVHDGDTFTLVDKQRIRMWGVDAPELKQPFGPEAKTRLEQLVNDRRVRVCCRSNSYKRRVCSYYAGKQSIEVKMVLSGLAFDSPEYSKGHYSKPQAYAKKHRRGVWSQPDGGIRPWDFRKTSKQKATRLTNTEM